VLRARQRTLLVATLAALASLAALAVAGCSFIVGVSEEPVVVAGDAALEADALGSDALEAAAIEPADGAGDAPAE
jgi:hypothetical protein